ncbi:copper-containing nitrite reductase [Kingella pumchi]|uniref:Copper-containing nitrite reductase n=1 Tax=Kingella pumchi TaxID=2779506 RepID=A0ABS9NKT9_9NEIS|nr:copper-containing nitrite reductase [Kingella pumchi]MCG6503285.1 copper-containing nitrite reductase [Kingella pumchi]
MKQQTLLATLIASLFALGACSPQPSADAKPAASGQAVASPAETASANTAASEAASQVAAADEPEIPEDQLEVIDAVMTHAPEAPPPIERNHAAKVMVKMEVQEKVMKMADGVEYKYWTFNGSVPGPMIRVRHGDTVEVQFANRSDSTVPHNVDFHAVTGTGGGAEATFTAPGHVTSFRFKALQPGLYIYHCATAPVGMHIANGMYGLILVEPKGGLPKVDKEFYVVQGDFYTKGKYGEAGLQDFDMEKAIKEQPEYVVFNGHVGSIAGDNALKATAGDKVRIFFGNGGPNLVSSFHVIGEIFDTVHVEGGDLINRNVQTTLVPAGGAAIVDFKVDVPGSYTLVDHSIFRTFNKGSLGQLKVDGEKNPSIYTGQLTEGVYQEAGKSASDAATGSQAAPASKPAGSEPAKKEAASEKADAGKADKSAQIKLGEAVYKANCIACHGPEGKGVEGAFPPLAGSDYLNSDHKRGIQAVVKGLSGKITVNGKEYNSVMPAVALKDDEVANVLTFVLNSFGNKGGQVSAADVAKAR